MTADAVFVHAGDRFLATDLALGPWAPGALHGGAPAALLVRAVGAHPLDERLRLARMTYEFVRPVPHGPLSTTVEVIRPGRRVTLLEATLRDGDTEVVRARALLLRPSELGEPARLPPPFPGPADGEVNDWHEPGRRMFATDAMEIRFVQGRFRVPGDSTAWFRLRYPLVAGEPTSPLERLVAASDFGNGIASVLSWDEHLFINPDLTIYVERPPEGEWVALQSQMRVGPGSVAVAESVLWDEYGRLGRATQSLLVERRDDAT
ncbi:MAG: thioesterase family protein [Solirubrobacteraceae bacterium]|jgi:acyl-coenzyme A thioesterase PaaI-like protein